jgi:hypothetical protein
MSQSFPACRMNSGGVRMMRASVWAGTHLPGLGPPRTNARRTRGGSWVIRRHSRALPLNRKSTSLSSEADSPSATNSCALGAKACGSDRRSPSDLERKALRRQYATGCFLVLANVTTKMSVRGSAGAKIVFRCAERADRPIATAGANLRRSLPPVTGRYARLGEELLGRAKDPPAFMHSTAIAGGRSVAAT